MRFDTPLDPPPDEARADRWWLALCAAALIALFLWASNADYVDAMQVECAQHGLVFDATSDRCVAPTDYPQR